MSVCTRRKIFKQPQGLRLDASIKDAILERYAIQLEHLNSWATWPEMCISLFSLASQGRIQSEEKGDRRHLEREICKVEEGLIGKPNLTTHKCGRLLSNIERFISFLPALYLA